MTFDELVADIIDHMLLVDTAIAVTSSPSVSDPKSHISYVQSMARGGIAAAVTVLRQAPDKSLLYALCRVSKGLAVNSDGYYTMGQGNVLGDATYDGEEIASTAQTPDKKVDGEIIAVEVTYTAAGAAASAPGPSKPFGSSTLWRYAEPDSAAAVRRRRALSSRHQVNLFSYDLVANRIYTAGTGVRVTFFPADFGAVATDIIPTGLHFLAMAEALSMLYGQKAGASGIAAAQYYAGRATQYKQILLSGRADYAPLPPYAGA